MSGELEGAVKSKRQEAGASMLEDTGARSLLARRFAKRPGRFDAGSAVGFDMTAALGLITPVVGCEG